MVIGGIKTAVEAMMSKDSDLCTFSCATELAHIYLDGVCEVRCLDEELCVFAREQNIYVANDYVEYLKMRTHVSAISTFFLCVCIVITHISN